MLNALCRPSRCRGSARHRQTGVDRLHAAHTGGEARVASEFAIRTPSRAQLQEIEHSGADPVVQMASLMVTLPCCATSGRLRPSARTTPRRHRRASLARGFETLAAWSGWLPLESVWTPHGHAGHAGWTSTRSCFSARAGVQLSRFPFLTFTAIPRGNRSAPRRRRPLGERRRLLGGPHRARSA
jgi:hypothetical protein